MVFDLRGTICENDTASSELQNTNTNFIVQPPNTSHSDTCYEAISEFENVIYDSESIHFSLPPLTELLLKLLNILRHLLLPAADFLLTV